MLVQTTAPSFSKEQAVELPTTQPLPPTSRHQLPQAHSRQSSDSSFRRYSGDNTEPFPPFPQPVTSLMDGSSKTADEPAHSDADARRH